MTEASRIIDETTEISSICYFNGRTGWWTESDKAAPAMQCDRILAYEENGHMAPLTFYAVYRNGGIIARVPATLAEVRYKIGGEA